MNMGDCPYEGCNGFFMLEIPDRTPAYALVKCEACARDVWYRFSRLDPMAWTVADFEAEHEIDRTTRQIVPRIQTP